MCTDTMRNKNMHSQPDSALGLGSLGGLGSLLAEERAACSLRPLVQTHPARGHTHARAHTHTDTH